AFADRVAHIRARHPDSSDSHLVNALYFEAIARAGSGELREVALATRSEAEVPADAHLAHLQSRNQKLGNEAIGGPSRKLGRERDDEQRIEAHRAQDLLLLRESEDLS